MAILVSVYPPSLTRIRVALRAGAHGALPAAAIERYNVPIHGGKIEDVELDGISAPADEVAACTGYEIRSHRVDFYGLCAGCR